MNIIRSAIFDSSNEYRYILSRKWNEKSQSAAFIMLNPSTADSNTDDNTIRRCIGFANSWGCGSLNVVNLFAYKATDPKLLRHAIDPVGKENDKYILQALSKSHIIIAAWGNNGHYLERDKKVLKLIKDNGYNVHCFEITKEGQPKHVLYVKKSTTPFCYTV